MQALATTAIDGSEVTFWVAYGGGEQWIELDLGSSHTVRKIRLLTEQSGTDFTEHNVYVGNTTPPTNLVATFTGTTVTNQWLDKTFYKQSSHRAICQNRNADKQ